MVLVLACAAAILVGRPSLLALEADPHPPNTPTGCTSPAPSTAEQYAAAFASIGDGWVAGDQTSSVPLLDGRVLWLFADTLVRPPGGESGPDGLRLVHSSFVIQSAGCFTTVLGPSSAEVLPAPAAGVWYWPQHGIADGQSLWVTALRVNRDPGDGLGFQLAGMDLAQFRVRPGAVPELVAVHRTPASDAGDFGVLWGAALALDGEQLHVYGTRRMPGPIAGKELLLARVPLDRVSDIGAWRFRTAHGWSAEQRRAAVLVPAQGGVSSALTAHRADSGWVLVTKRGDFLGEAVIALVGPRPWGPFETRELFASHARGGSLEYVPLAHPEARLADRSLLVSLNHNELCLADVLQDPARFRPSFHAVPGLGCVLAAVPQR